MSKKFIFTAPQNYRNRDGRIIYMGDLQVEAQANTYRCDGTMRTCDIISVKWDDEDVTKYISACHPEKWDELMAAAENNFKSSNNEL